MDTLGRVLALVEVAGQRILDIYRSNDFGVERKSDNSPLTRADLASHETLVNGLRSLNKGPILSEEGGGVDWSERKGWTQYWLIDPLDGTKEFIKRNDEFTVNVAFIVDGSPVMGVVYAPAMNMWYVGEKGKGAFKRIGNSRREWIKPAPVPGVGKQWRVVGSRSYSSPDFDAFMAAFPNSTLLSVGSSLKLCMVAEGKADLYPRLILTSEWDTAAAQAVVEAAGGVVLNWETKQVLTYNTKESLLNPYFIVCADKSVAGLLPVVNILPKVDSSLR